MAGMASLWILSFFLVASGFGWPTRQAEPMKPMEPVTTGDQADRTQREAEASAEQVEADLKRLSSFTTEVRQTLDEADRAKLDVQHAVSHYPLRPFAPLRRRTALSQTPLSLSLSDRQMGYFRQQSTLQQDARDASQARSLRLEQEVATLQRKIQALENEKAGCLADKATLAEANKKVLDQMHSMFRFGESVASNLAYKGLAAAGNANTKTA